MIYKSLYIDRGMAATADEDSAAGPNRASIVQVARQIFGEAFAPMLSEAGIPTPRAIWTPTDNPMQCNNTTGKFQPEKPCYICGLEIADGDQECEHILPIADAIKWLSLYSTRTMAAGWYSKYELALIYRWAHKHCNQIKSNFRFIVENYDTGLFVLNGPIIKEVMTNIFTNPAYGRFNITIQKRYKNIDEFLTWVTSPEHLFMQTLTPIVDYLNATGPGSTRFISLIAALQLISGLSATPSIAHYAGGESEKDREARQTREQEAVKAAANEAEAVRIASDIEGIKETINTTVPGRSRSKIDAEVDKYALLYEYVYRKDPVNVETIEKIKRYIIYRVLSTMLDTLARAGRAHDQMVHAMGTMSPELLKEVERLKIEMVGELPTITYEEYTQFGAALEASKPDVAAILTELRPRLEHDIRALDSLAAVADLHREGGGAAVTTLGEMRYAPQYTFPNFNPELTANDYSIVSNWNEDRRQWFTTLGHKQQAFLMNVMTDRDKITLFTRIAPELWTDAVSSEMQKARGQGGARRGRRNKTHRTRKMTRRKLKRSKTRKV